MNPFSLFCPPDTEVEINEKVYIMDNTALTVIQVLTMLEDKDVSPVMKVDIALNLFLGQIPALNPAEKTLLLDQLMKLYVFESAETPQVDIEGNPLPVKAENNYFSFLHDAGMIYAAFWQAYGIDLDKELPLMKWDRFHALLCALPEDTKLSKVVEIRARPYPTGKNTGEARKNLRRLKKLHSYPGRDFSVENG